MSSLQQNRAYYDAFSQGYDSRRAGGYHALLDDLEAELVLRHAHGGDVLEAGCGTGLILSRLAPKCRSVTGFDLSGGMLSKAHGRGHRVVQANLLSVPFKDASFDAVCCFKVLPHIERIQDAMVELGRLVRPGGVLIAEFYNPRSVRGAIWAVKRPGKVAAGLHEKDVFVRFDDPARVASYLPPGFVPVDERGARVLTILPQAHAIPLFGPALARLERLAADPLAKLGSFYSVVARKQ